MFTRACRSGQCHGRRQWGLPVHRRDADEQHRESASGGVSYTNDFGLDPRPQAGSPALANVAPQGAGLMQTSYRGAFGPDDQWAHKWTAIYNLGHLRGVWTGPGEEPPQEPGLFVGRSGSDFVIRFLSETGVDYQLQSTAALPASGWNDEVLPGCRPVTMT